MLSTTQDLLNSATPAVLITIDGKRMLCNRYQVFMGARYDRQLTFAEHVRKLCQSMPGRLNLLRAVEGTTWGWHTLDCCQVYIAIMRRMLEYAAAAWARWLSATSTSKHEKVQFEMARAITVLVRSTPVEAVIAEYQQPPILMCFKTISLLKANQ